MADITIIQPYMQEWNKRNPNNTFAELVRAEVFPVAGHNYVNLYLPIYVGGVLHKEKLMQTLSRGQSFISVEDALKHFFDKYPKFSDFDYATRKVDPLAPTEYFAPANDTPITFDIALRSADEKGFHIPCGYILVNELPKTLPDALPNTPPQTTTEKPKIGIGWILLGIAVGGLVLYKIAKK